MPKYDPYHPNYKKLYPGIEDRPEILDVLKRGDRKMEYIEVDLKVERFVQNQETSSAMFLPSREDSYDRLCDEEQVQFASSDLLPEDVAIHNEQLHLLRAALAKLEPADAELIQALFYRGLSERQLSKETGVPYMTIHNRKVRVLKILKKIMTM